MPTPNPHATLAAMVLAAVVVVSCSTGAHATPRTIYASSTAGSDSNSGLSPSSAVRTLGRVNSMQLTAQDTLLLRAGDRWCGEQLVLAPPAASAPGTLTVATFNGTAQATLGLSSLIPASFPAPAPGTPDPAAVVVARNFPAGSGLAMDNLVLTAADFGLVASTIASLNLTRMVFLDIRNRSTIGQSNPTPGQRDCANGWTPAVYLSNVGGSSISVERSLFVDIDVAFQVMGPPTASSRFVGNTVTGASGNTVMAINSADFQISGNVFTNDHGTRFFQCGTTDVMIGGITANVSITGNEFAGRGEHTMSPDGCAIDLEGGSDGALIAGNVIHDSYGAGVMLFGLSDPSRNISNAHVHDNVFVRNGGMQTSDDHGELVFMEKGSTGVVENNIFFAMDTDPAFVLRPRVNGSTDGFELRNNSIHPVGDIASHIAPTPALAVIGVDYATQVSELVLTCRSCAEVGVQVAAHVTTDGSWPTVDSPVWVLDKPYTVDRTTAVNARFFVTGGTPMLPSLTATFIVRVPAYTGPLC